MLYCMVTMIQCLAILEEEGYVHVLEKLICCGEEDIL